MTDTLRIAALIEPSRTVGHIGIIEFNTRKGGFHELVYIAEQQSNVRKAHE
jgi:hypothetical protein